MRKQANQRILMIAVAVMLIVGVGVALLTSGTPAKAPVSTTLIAQATPTGPRPDCGVVVKKSEYGGAAFPVINTANCPPDTSRLQRRGWNPIAARLSLSGAAVNDCQDWYAYHTNQTGNWEIFRWNAKDKTINLSRSEKDAEIYSLGPSLSPDRSSVAFTSNREGNWEIYLAPSDGTGEVQRLTYNTFAVDIDPVWSSNGRTLVYESNRKGNWDLFTFDVQTGEEIQLTDNAANDSFPVWSPDGKRVMYQSQKDGLKQLWEIEVEGFKTRKLSDGKGLDSDPIYSPDGSRIAFLSVRDGNKNTVVYTASADGSNPVAVSDPAMVASNQSFAPNGNLIAYQGSSGKNPSLYLYDMNARRTRQLTDGGVPSYAPTWDCNSSLLVFTANIGKNPALFSVPASMTGSAPMNVGTDAKTLTTGDAAAQFPVGAPREEKASKKGISSELTALTGKGG